MMVKCKKQVFFLIIVGSAFEYYEQQCKCKRADWITLGTQNIRMTKEIFTLAFMQLHRYYNSVVLIWGGFKICLLIMANCKPNTNV